MLPYLAQGANSSLEDGAVLGELLGKMTDKVQLPDVLRMYERLRKERGEAIVRETFKQVGLTNNCVFGTNPLSLLETRFPHAGRA
jgi:2-polyprenyl-6-methoxyphenol hydroxylase-like FAD-dependent oxidoreductase